MIVPDAASGGRQHPLRRGWLNQGPREQKDQAGPDHGARLLEPRNYGFTAPQAQALPGCRIGRPVWHMLPPVFPALTGGAPKPTRPGPLEGILTWFDHRTEAGDGLRTAVQVYLRCSKSCSGTLSPTSGPYSKGVAKSGDFAEGQRA